MRCDRISEGIAECEVASKGSVLRRELDFYSLTDEYAVLAYLRVQPGASNAALARQAFVTPQTMQAILVTMERAGFIKRTQDPEHGRIQKTELMPAGDAALTAASSIVADAERRLVDAAAPLERDVVVAMLTRLAFAMRQA